MGFLEVKDEKEIVEMSDEEVFALSLADPTHFRVILDRYQESFLRKAKGVLYREDEAVDVVSETFTKIYLKGNSFVSQGEGSFKSWAYRVLMNTAFTAYQKKKRIAEVSFPEEFEEYFPDLRGEEARESKETADYVASILNRLPESMSDILNKFFLQGKTQEEIAMEEGLSVGAVKTRVYRAKEAFRNINVNII